MQNINFILIFAGLGLFLYGMSLLEEAIRSIAGQKMKQILSLATKSKIYSIATGFIATSVLQSSTVVTMITLSFVGAELMTLAGGIGVIFGSNIGTAFSTAVIGLVGFKANIESLVLPLLAFGGIGQIVFTKKPKIKPYFLAIIGLGLLFSGLNYLKEGMSFAASNIDLAALNGQSILLYIGVGVIITNLVQSSTASTAILLSAIEALKLDLKYAFAMIIGFNIGTTTTALIGAIGGSPDKKRVAFAHLLFNFITATIILLIFDPLKWLILDVANLKNDPISSILAFHISFNLIGVLALGPFIEPLTHQLQKLFAKQEQVITKYIHLVEPSFHTAAIEALKKEVINYFDLVCEYLLNVVEADQNTSNLKKETKYKFITQIKSKDNSQSISQVIENLSAQCIAYLVKMENSGEFSKTDQEQKTALLNAIRLIDQAVNSFKDIKSHIQSYKQDENSFIQAKYNKFKNRVISLIDNLEEAKKTTSTNRNSKKIQDYLVTIRHEDQLALKNIVSAVGDSKIAEIDASGLLSTNRIIYLASEWLIQAFIHLNNNKHTSKPKN